MAVAPWIVSDELWQLVEPLLPKKERRFRYPGRKRLSDREALQGILFVLHTGIAWTHLPQELGFGSGVTCWRRLDEWQRAGVWERLHVELLSRLRAAGEIEWSRAVVDSSQIRAKKGAPRRARARSTEAVQGRSITSSSMPAGSSCLGPDRLEPQRRRATAASRRGGPAGCRRCRSTPTEARERGRRPRIRLGPPSRRAAQAGDHASHRSPSDRARLRARTRALGRGAHDRPPAQLQTAARSLRATRRHARSPTRARLLPHLLPPP